MLYLCAIRNVFHFAALPINNFTSKLSKDSKHFQQNLKVVQHLIHSPVKARHWEAILCSTGKKVMKTATLTIEIMTNLKVNLVQCCLNYCVKPI